MVGGMIVGCATPGPPLAQTDASPAQPAPLSTEQPQRPAQPSPLPVSEPSSAETPSPPAETVTQTVVLSNVDAVVLFGLIRTVSKKVLNDRGLMFDPSESDARHPPYDSLLIKIVTERRRNEKAVKRGQASFNALIELEGQRPLVEEAAAIFNDKAVSSDELNRVPPHFLDRSVMLLRARSSDFSVIPEPMGDVAVPVGGPINDPKVREEISRDPALRR